MNRREFMLAGAAAASLPLFSFAGGARMPTLFYAHGAPFLATNLERGAQLKGLIADLPGRPRGIVAVTPHVRAEYVSLASEGVARRSFPRRFIERVGDIDYTPPLATELAARVRGLLSTTGVPLADRPHPAYNHTIWMGLHHLFPASDIPLVEMAMPFLPAVRLFELGRALAPLRDEGVLVISTGALTHNLASLFVESTPAWAIEFDQWIGETLVARDLDAVIDWRNRAPSAEVAHPDDGAHFNVVLYALGAAVGNGNLDHAEALNPGWEFGSFSTRDYVFA